MKLNESIRTGNYRINIKKKGFLFKRDELIIEAEYDTFFEGEHFCEKCTYWKELTVMDYLLIRKLKLIEEK